MSQLLRCRWWCSLAGGALVMGHWVDEFSRLERVVEGEEQRRMRRRGSRPRKTGFRRRVLLLCSTSQVQLVVGISSSKHKHSTFPRVARGHLSCGHPVGASFAYWKCQYIVHQQIILIVCFSLLTHRVIQVPRCQAFQVISNENKCTRKDVRRTSCEVSLPWSQ